MFLKSHGLAEPLPVELQDHGVTRPCRATASRAVYNTKWKRPLSEEIHSQIKCKKGFGENLCEIEILPVGYNIQIKEIKLNGLSETVLKKNRI